MSLQLLVENAIKHNLADKVNPLRITIRIVDKAYVGIQKIEDYFGNRLILKLNLENDREAIVSREKVNGFKKWLGK